MYEEAVLNQVSQGDIIQGVEYRYVIDGPEGEPAITGRTIRAALLTDDCEYDKPNCTFVYVGEVKPLATLNRGTQGSVRSYQVFSTFYLPGKEGAIDESYIDFRAIYRLPKSHIEVASEDGNRFLSVTKDGRLALQEQLSRFFGLGRRPPATDPTGSGNAESVGP